MASVGGNHASLRTFGASQFILRQPLWMDDGKHPVGTDIISFLATPTAALVLRMILITLRRLDRNLREVKQRLARAAGMNLADLEPVLAEAAKVDDRVARKILGVSDASVRLRNNVPLQRALRAQYAETAGRLSNLSNSTVVQDAYRKAVDAAVTAVQSGAEDYESAIRRTLRRAGEMGLRVRDTGTGAVAYQSGLTRRVDTAVRMNVLDAMRRMNQRVMEEVGEQFGADGVEIDAHMLCAEDHLPYQGQQYSKEEFQDIQDSLDRPFGEWNCRHTWAPIILGVSPRAYTDEDLQKFERYSTEEVEIDGVSHTRYEWSQAMRRMETAIREKKDTATLAAAAGDDQLRRECQGSVNAMMREYERLSDRTGLGPDFRRTYVGGFKDINVLTDNQSSGTMKAQGVDRVASIQSPIEQRNTGKGNPSAMLHFDRPLNTRQQAILAWLPEFDDRVIVDKRDVSLRDLSALTAKTGDEYALFTCRGKRMVIRGNAFMTNITVETARQMAAQGWKWSGHTHPGTDHFCLFPSDGDKAILSAFKQDESCIVNSMGMWNTFRKDE